MEISTLTKAIKLNDTITRLHNAKLALEAKAELSTAVSLLTYNTAITEVIRASMLTIIDEYLTMLRDDLKNL